VGLVGILLAANRATAGDYDAAVLAANPEAYWRFEDATASDGAVAADATGNHPGVYTGGATLITPPHGGKAAHFDGVAQHVTADTLGTTGSALATGVTFEFLFRSTDTAQDRLFGTFNNGANTSVTIASNSNETFVPTVGKTQLFARRQGAGDLAASFDMSVVNIYDGGWHHFVWRLDDMTTKGVGATGAPADPTVFQVTIDNKPIPLTYGATFATTPSFVDFENPFRIAQAGRATPFGDDAPAADIDEFDGDFDFDGDIDLEDFGKFKAIYPAVVEFALGVPEPGALVLVLSGAFLFGCQRCRRACA
jgi:hypothetical protein